MNLNWYKWRSTKNNLTKLVSSPYFLSLFVSAIIILSLPPVFDKYKIIINERVIKDSNIFNYYSDLNNDGSNERIEFCQIKKDFFSVKVLENEKIINQWNSEGRYLLSLEPLIDNINNDKYSEVFFFTFRNSKVYLSCLSPFENKFITQDKFVCDYKPRIDEMLMMLYSQNYLDTNRDGVKEFYFVCTVGYSIQPRLAAKYDPVTDSILTSPKSYAAFIDLIANDSDSELKFFTVSNAVGNGSPEDPYSDHFAWLMCFDSNLLFKYEPIKIGYFPSLSNMISVYNDSAIYFACLNLYSGIENHPGSLFLINSRLQILKIKRMDYSKEMSVAKTYSTKEKGYFYLVKQNGEVDKYNLDLNVVDELSIPPLSSEIPIQKDLDGDDETEFIYFSKGYNQLVIVNEDFTSNTLIDITGFGYLRNYSLQVMNNGQSKLVISSDNEEMSISYESNILFYLRYPMYGGVYVAVLMIFLLIQKEQKRRAELKYETEKRIAELQLKSIKNQIDPHFTLNILNSIGSLFYKQDRDKADYVFGKYSKLLRLTVLNSDKIITSLSEELEYVENYLELEKFRNGNRFNWKIDIDKDVDVEIKIPKMLIHTFIENSVKHGLRNSEQGGQIGIIVKKDTDKYLITTFDNGVGRKESKKHKNESTGKGLGILDQILDLYYNLMKIKISYSYKDILDANGNSSGTEVTVIIPVVKI